MISSFEVGAVFKIINEASPALGAILKQIRELNVAIDKAKGNLAGIGKVAGLGGVVGETQALATAWREVAAASAAATGNLTRATAAGRNAAASAATGGGGGGGRGRLGGRLGMGGGGPHISGPGVGLPGGGHVRLGGAAMVGAGTLGYGVVQAADMEKVAWWVTYHAHEQQTEANHAKYRKIIGDAMIDTGFDMKDTAEAATDAIRMFQGTPAGGSATLATMLRVAAKEALSKGSSLKESMSSFVGLAHMTGAYTNEDIEKLAPAFAALSTADPRSLTSMTRAAGYAVPLLHSGLEIDPLTTLALGTALAGAGALNTKSGSWTRQMMTGAMPGTSLMSKFLFHKHHEGLKALGLVDDQENPTWFTGGRPDPLKMLDIGGDALAKIPLKDRAGLEKAAFGTQGSEGFAMLSNKAVLERVHNLEAIMKDPEIRSHYMSLLPDLQAGSTVQNARSTLQEFNVTMAELGRDILPSVNVSLGIFRSMLEGVRSMLPGSDGKSLATVGGHALVGVAGGAVAGAVIGAIGGPIGMGAGALIGGVAGGMEGAAETYMKNLPAHSAGLQANTESLRGLSNALNAHGVFAGHTKNAPIPTVSINLDGRLIGQSVSSSMEKDSTFSTGAPAADGMDAYSAGDHHQMDH